MTVLSRALMSYLPRRSTRLAIDAAKEVTTTSTVKNKRKYATLTTNSTEDNATGSAIAGPSRTRRRVTVVEESFTVVDLDSTALRVDEDIPKKTRKRTKALEEPKPEDYPPRVLNEWKVGPHVSAAGAVENAIWRAASVGANAFALFVKSQRKWVSSPLTQETVERFKARMRAFGYGPEDVLPHGSYLVNLGNPDKEKRQKSYECFLDDLKRCELLGLKMYNFHPGSTLGIATLEESIGYIAECINKAHSETGEIVILLENMAGAGNIIGSQISDLASIIQKVFDKSRIGVCLDTCHLFAAGYDIRTNEGYESTISQFDKEIGLAYLRAMHLNDSKTGLGSKKDRHENIGLGTLTLATFSRILTDPRLKNIPMILETPMHDDEDSTSHDHGAGGGGDSMRVWRAEVGVLNKLSISDFGAVGSGGGVNVLHDGDGSKHKEEEGDENEHERNSKRNERLDELVEEIREAVNLAEAEGGNKSVEKKNKSKKNEKKGKVE